MSPPSRRTPRLLLRGWRPEDLDGLARINADPEVTRHLGGGRPLTRQETAALQARLEREWDEEGFGIWALESAGELVGLVGLHRHRWFPEEVEVGWRLAREHWGQGLATEGARAALDYGFGDLALERVISLIQVENLASRRVAEKLGMRPERQLTRVHEETGRPLALVVYSLRREDWSPISPG